MFDAIKCIMHYGANCSSLSFSWIVNCHTLHHLISCKILKTFLLDGLRKQQIADNDYDCGGPFQTFVGNPTSSSYHHHNSNANSFVNPGPPANPMVHGPGPHIPNQGMIGQTSGGPMILNPIDRLYSMQNMYFCGEKMADDQI